MWFPGIYKKGLALRLSLSILSSTALLVFGILSYNYYFSKKLLLESARETAEQLTRATLNRMETVLVSAERVPEGLKLFLEYPGATEHSIREMLQFILKNKPEIFGSTVAFAPYAFDAEKRSLAPYVYRSGDSLAFVDLGQTNYDYFSKEWYLKVKEGGKALWTEPYLDSGGGNALMTTYSEPVFAETPQGKTFRGVATADLSLEWLEDLMNSIHVMETGYVFLLSSTGIVITHPVEEFQMLSILDAAKERNNESMAGIAQLMMSEQEGYFPFKSLIDNRPSWMYFSTLPQTGWRMAVVFPEAELFAGLHQLLLFTVFIGIAGIILLSLIVILFSSQIIKPLRRLTLSAQEIGKGHFDVKIHEDRSSREITLLGSALARMQQELKEYIHHLEVTTSAKERIESELHIAHDIQQGMIPKIFPPFPDRKDLDIFAILEPARQVGGDFYDFFFLDEHTLCFVIGDVSDKGVPASLLMATTITLFRAKAALNLEVDELIRKLNRDISRDNRNYMFITCFAGIVDLKTGELSYCNAGHNYPLLAKRNGDILSLQETHGIPLGIDEAYPYHASSHRMHKGDVLLLYTDGVSEAMNAEGELYGEQRLLDTFRSVIGTGDPGIVSNAIVEDVASFANTPEKSDDLTLMVLMYYPENKIDGHGSTGN